MSSPIHALLLVAATLVLAGTVHTVSTATAGTQVAIALIPASASAPIMRSSQMRGASVRAIAIGY